MAVELAILTPFVIVMLLLVVAFGRVTHARTLVDSAAAAGARAASLSASPGQASGQGREAGLAALTSAGLACTAPSVDVDTSELRPGGQVAVTVRCIADLSALTMLGVPGTIALSADAFSPVESHRDVSGGLP
jgi:Flp pilus assembly protein TadG